MHSIYIGLVSNHVARRNLFQIFDSLRSELVTRGTPISSTMETSHVLLMVMYITLKLFRLLGDAVHTQCSLYYLLT